MRGRALLDGGTEELLASLPRMLRWRAPVLESDYPVDRDLYLDGRGLLLQPSYFCRGTPVVLRDPALPPVLVYPITHCEAPTVREPGGSSLAKLVGTTRSAVLHAIGDGGTTSELARRAGVSLASASQHAGVLREAGLVATLRHGNAVLHTLTPLGAALLGGARGRHEGSRATPGTGPSPRSEAKAPEPAVGTRGLEHTLTVQQQTVKARRRLAVRARRPGPAAGNRSAARRRERPGRDRVPGPERFSADSDEFRPGPPSYLS